MTTPESPAEPDPVKPPKPPKADKPKKEKKAKRPHPVFEEHPSETKGKNKTRRPSKPKGEDDTPEVPPTS